MCNLARTTSRTNMAWIQSILPIMCSMQWTFSVQALQVWSNPSATYKRHHWFRQKLSHKLVAYVSSWCLSQVGQRKKRLWFTAKANIAKLLPKNCLENAGISHTDTHASICAEDKNVRSILKVPLILFFHF